MDFVFEKEWKDLLETKFSAFDLADELEAVLFVLGVQILGQGNRKYSKDDKINLMHISVCTILEPYGFFRFVALDNHGWPHFARVKDLPILTGIEQERFLKEAMISYFQSTEKN